uniref:Uncharacterized protein n=1 Tax=Klebsiella pneumoniae TaxID=573 RepID=A0A8B0SRD9_KLEPN|nr:hypothetical protein [Klebsiella pneumoniae]
MAHQHKCVGCRCKYKKMTSVPTTVRKSGKSDFLREYSMVINNRSSPHNTDISKRNMLHIYDVVFSSLFKLYTTH